MSFDTKCPECGTRCEAEDDWEGLETECPSCGKEIVITKMEEVKEPAP